MTIAEAVSPDIRIKFPGSHQFSMRGLGVNFEEPEGVARLDGEWNMISRRDRLNDPDSAYYFAAGPLFNSVDFYRFLTAMKTNPEPFSPAAALADWKNPQFVNEHRKFGPPGVWDTLIANLQPLIDVVEHHPEAVVTKHWQKLIPRLLDGGFFAHVAKLPEEIVRQSHVDWLQTNYNVGNNYTDWDAYAYQKNPWTTNMYESLREYIYDNEGETFGNMLAELRQRGLLEKFDDESFATRFYLSGTNGGIIRSSHAEMKAIFDLQGEGSEISHKTLHEIVRRYVTRLGQTPAERAIRLMKISNGEELSGSPHRFNFYETPATQAAIPERDEVIVRYTKINDLTISRDRTGLGDPVAISLNSNFDELFFAHDEKQPPTPHLLPIICYKKGADGKRKLLHSKEEILQVFPDMQMALYGDPNLIPSTVAGYMDLVYAQPHRREFQHRLPLETGGDKQGMNEVQILYLTAIKEYSLLNGALFLDQLEAQVA